MEKVAPLGDSFQTQKTQPSLNQMIAFRFGRGGGIRTHGLYVPNVARYRTALHPDTYFRLLKNFNPEKTFIDIFIVFFPGLNL